MLAYGGAGEIFAKAGGVDDDGTGTHGCDYSVVVFRAWRGAEFGDFLEARWIRIGRVDAALGVRLEMERERGSGAAGAQDQDVAVAGIDDSRKSDARAIR